MIVEEKGLMKLMKAARQNFGYHVAVTRTATGVKSIIIATDTGRWAVVMEHKSAPRKVLGLLAEHMGIIPDPGEGYLVRKKEVQSEMSEIVTGMLSDMNDEDKPLLFIKRTALNYGGYQLWQRREDLRIFKVDPELENILLLPTNEAQIIGNHVLKAEDLESRAYIATEQTEDVSNAWLNHLSQIQWVAM